MPGKHAPDSPASFYLSVARAAGGALAALALVVAIAMVAVNSRADDTPRANGTPTTSAPATSERPAGESPSPGSSLSPEPSQPSEAEPVRAPSKTTVDVLNGTSRSGLARALSERIDKEGYKIGTVGNASPATKTTIFYRKDARAEAEALLRAFPELKRVREASAGTPGQSLLTVVIGSNYEA